MLPGSFATDDEPTTASSIPATTSKPKPPYIAVIFTSTRTAEAQSPGWTALRALLRSPAWHLLVFAGNDDAGGRDQVTGALPTWVDTITVRPRRREDDDLAVWDPDGRVRDTLVATTGDWLLVRPDGYLSARGSGDTDLRAALDEVAGRREPVRA